MQPAPLAGRAPATAQALRVTVLRGGPSAERDVSLQSGKAVADALRRCGHQVFEADIQPGDLRALDHPADVIFPVLHGPFGEDGQVQKLMEGRGLRFVGSGSEASQVAMNKVATKIAAIEAGLPTPEYQVLTRQDVASLRLAPPVVVKPVDQGSSVATHIVHDAEKLGPALNHVLGLYGQALVERFIRGDEITIGIVGYEPLPPICIRPRRSFYDYEAKYLADDTEYLFDAGHPPELLARLATMSLKLFKGLGCRHLARVDWMVDAHENPWLLEVNTIPGFTSHSLVPKAAGRIGIGFEELVDRLIRMPLEDPS